MRRKIPPTKVLVYLILLAPAVLTLWRMVETLPASPWKIPQGSPGGEIIVFYRSDGGVMERTVPPTPPGKWWDMPVISHGVVPLASICLMSFVLIWLIPPHRRRLRITGWVIQGLVDVVLFALWVLVFLALAMLS